MARKNDITISRKDAQHVVGVLKKIVGLLNMWGRPGTARELEELISIVGGTLNDSRGNEKKVC